MDGSHSLLIRQTAVWHSDAARGPSTPSFDHLIGAGEQGCRYVEVERLRRLQVDHQLVLSRRLHWQIGGLLAFKDTIDIASRAPIMVDQIGSVGDQAARDIKESFPVDRRQFVSGRQRDDQFAMAYCGPA